MVEHLPAMLTLAEDIEELVLVEECAPPVKESYKRMRSLLPWMGGKYYQSDKIVPEIMRPKVSHYVEVFGGGASVLLAKPAHKTEVYNDRNGDLVNFWMQVRDNHEQFVHELEFLPYSEDLYMQWRDVRTEEYKSLPPLEKAIRYYYTIRNGFSAVMGSLTGWGYSKHKSRAKVFRRSLDMFEPVRNRFYEVDISSRDWREIIRLHDGPNTVFYLDPPYVKVGAYIYPGCKDWAADVEHIEMARILSQIEGYATVSYYASPLLDELYRGWRVVEYEHYKYSRNTKIEEGDRTTVPEILLCNFDDNGNRLDVPIVL